MLSKVRATLSRRFSEQTDVPVDSVDNAQEFRDMREDELDWWQQTFGLEALNLESLNQPYLSPMQRRVISKEELLLAEPRAKDEALATHVERLLERRLSDEETTAVQNGQTVALVEPSDAKHAGPRRPSRIDAFGKEAVLNPMPKRPSLTKLHRPRSDHGLGKAPLLHQAVRRQHQRSLANRILDEIFAPPARPSLLRHGYSLLSDDGGNVTEKPISPRHRAPSDAPWN